MTNPSAGTSSINHTGDSQQRHQTPLLVNLSYNKQVNMETPRILEKDGKQWYSESYLIQAIEGAYWAGLFNAQRTSACIMIDGEPEKSAEAILDHLREVVGKQFHEHLHKGIVWRKGPSYNRENIDLLPISSMP